MKAMIAGFLTLITCALTISPEMAFAAGGVVGGGSTGGGLSAHKCPEGRRAYFEVHSGHSSAGARAEFALATCLNGKYIFDDDAYNYRPTKGLARCKEGYIEYGRRSGHRDAANDFDQICIDGRMVRMN